MNFLFINYALETFTPTQSGALATIIRECSLAAMRQGFQPTVLTGRSAAQPYSDVPILAVDPPKQPKGRLDRFTLRAERKLFSYRHMGHRGYVRRVIRAIRNAGLADVPMILQNDPELVCNLRHAFPKARLIHWFQNQHSSKDRFRRSFGSSIDRVAAVSDFTGRWIECHYNLPAGSAKTIHNGVNVSEFSPASSVPTGKPIINFVGRTGIEKAPDTILKAALELSKERTDFALQLLGSNHWDRFEMDGYQRQLLDLATELENRGVEVRRPGFIDRYTLPFELRKSSIHVVPSRWEEPCALTIIEGLATGIPVIASRTGGTPEIVGDAGFLFEKDNVAELTAHLRTLVADPELRKTYGQKARVRARTTLLGENLDGIAIAHRDLTTPASAPPMARPAQICFLNPQGEFYSPISGGAVATITMQTAAALMRRSHFATIVTATNGDELYPIGKVVLSAAPQRHELSSLQRAVSKLRRNFNQWDTAYYDRYLASYAKAFRSIPIPDAVVVYNDFVSPRYIKSLLPHTRVIVNLQNEQGTIQSQPAAALTCVHRFLACSNHIRAWTCEKYNLDPARFAVLHSGVDLSTFYPRPNFDSPASPLKVLFIGRIDPNKGPDIAANAVIALRQQGVRIELTVAGGLWFYGHGNEMADAYFRTLKTKMDAASADYVGHVTRPDVPALVRAHDVVCVLSRSREPFGLVVLEAMASGCAVLSSNRGGLPDACGSAGVMLDPDNLPAIIGQLRIWATNSAVLTEAKRESLARAATASWDRLAEEFEQAVLQ